MTAANPQSPIVGTWRLKAFTEQEVAGAAISYPMGQHPEAMVIYTADGFAATIFTGSNRAAPTAALPSDQEAAELYRSMVAFAGRYEIAGDRLTYIPQVSWNQVWNNTRQERRFEVRDDRLYVRSVPFASALSGKQVVMAMEWERA